MSGRSAGVWLRLIEMFGGRMVREYGEEPPETWVMAIDRLQDRQLTRALANLADEGLQHPPTLPQFVAAARRLPPVRHLGVPMLERKKADPEKAKQNLARLRALLRGGRHGREDGLGQLGDGLAAGVTGAGDGGGAAVGGGEQEVGAACGSERGDGGGES